MTCLNCILSKDPLDGNDIGYQAPEPKEVKPERKEIVQKRPAERGGKPPQRRYNEPDERYPPQRGRFNVEGPGFRGGRRGGRVRDDTEYQLNRGRGGPQI